MSSKTSYTVPICANPSSTCQDNRKHEESVLCKHVMFILLKTLDVMDESILTNTYVEKDDLVSMFSSAAITILENLYVPFKAPKRNLVTILQEHSVTLGKKQGRSANCVAYRYEFNIGDIVLRIEN